MSSNRSTYVRIDFAGRVTAAVTVTPVGAAAVQENPVQQWQGHAAVRAVSPQENTSEVRGAFTGDKANKPQLPQQQQQQTRWRDQFAAQCTGSDLYLSLD